LGHGKNVGRGGVGRAGESLKQVPAGGGCMKGSKGTFRETKKVEPATRPRRFKFSLTHQPKTAPTNGGGAIFGPKKKKRYRQRGAIHSRRRAWLTPGAEQTKRMAKEFFVNGPCQSGAAKEKRPSDVPRVQQT